MTKVKSIQPRRHIGLKASILCGVRRLAREPLMHFLIFAALFLGVYQLVTGESGDKPDIIVVSGEQIEQLHTLLAQGLQRSPTEQEVKAAIDDYVKEEIYYREAKKLGLDQDDTVIRRRLRQKMEFLGDVAAEQVKPTELDLQSYFAANKDKFAGEPSLAFQQVFLSVSLRGEAASSDAHALLTRLASNQEEDFTQLGDSTSLPPEMPMTPASGISAVFGDEFTAALEKLQPGTWAGPIPTSFGLHIVRLTERRDGAVPDLSAVRADVEREWAYAKRQELEDARFAEYLKKYQVKILVSKQEGTP